MLLQLSCGKGLRNLSVQIIADTVGQRPWLALLLPPESRPAEKGKHPLVDLPLFHQLLGMKIVDHLNQLSLQLASQKSRQFLWQLRTQAHRHMGDGCGRIRRKSGDPA